MSCVYYLKGVKTPFKSELELEDYLLEHHKGYQYFGDAVFSMGITEQQEKILDKIQEHQKITLELKKKNLAFMRSSAAQFDENGNLLNGIIPPYTGVTKFLGKVKNVDGKHFAPEFNSENLWENLRSNFIEGIYQKDIAEYLFGPGDDGTSHKLDPSDFDTFKDYRKRIEKKWKEQAYTGTAIHEVLELLFSKISAKGAPYKIRLQTLGSDMMANVANIRSKLDPKNAERLSDSNIKETIEIAKKFYSELNSSLEGPLMFYTELPITAKSNKGAEDCSDQLYGIADLVVIDKNGQTHLVDYKTSTHAFSEYSSAKYITVLYQLGLYQRILSSIGLNVKQKKAYLLPIQMENFRQDPSSGKFVFDTCKTEGMRDITSDLSQELIQNNLNELIPFVPHISLPADQVVRKVKDQMAKWFSTYSDKRKVDEKWLRDKIKKGKGFQVTEHGTLEFKFGTKEFVVQNGPEAEAKLMEQIKKYIEDDYNLRRTKYDVTVAALKEGIKNETAEVEFPKTKNHHYGLSATWFKDQFAKYCNSDWDIIECEPAEEFGVILLRNKNTQQIDVKRISTQNLDYGIYNTKEFKESLNNKNVSNYKNLCAGIGRNDLEFSSQSDSLIAEATFGNIELIETMLLLNALGTIDDLHINGLQVLNPGQAYGMSLSNEELLYNWNQLKKTVPIDIEDNFANGNIKLASKYQIAFDMFKDIMQSGEKDKFKNSFKQFKGYTDALADFYKGIDHNEVQITQLENLRKRLEKDFQADLESVSDTNQYKKHVQLYNQVLIALADKKGIKFRQQLKDHSQWLESTHILEKGISGTYTDNPGNLSSDTLNTITSMVTQAYQTTRDQMKIKANKVRELVDKLKAAKNFTGFSERTFGNQTSLYTNMTYMTPDGDFLFKKPEDLSMPEEREFLEFVLNEINRNRYSNFSDVELEKMKNENDVRYYRVPLDIASSSSKHQYSQGMMQTIKDVFRYLNPSYAWKKARQKMEGIFEAEADIHQQQANESFYKMVNRFSVTHDESNNRITEIAKIGIENIEHNLETLVLKHDLAYIMKDKMDEVFPMIKAAMIHLTMSANLQNDPSSFKTDKKYLKEYVMNKIFNQSIMDPRYQDAAKYATSLRYAASIATLALSPVQFFYQMIQGLLTDIKLYIVDPDGRNTFTFANMKKAAKLVYADLFHDSRHPTLFSKINEQYALNDMDMNQYAEKLSSDKFGIHNFSNFLMKFSSRPDYYNRCLIFGTQMEADKCLDAHSLINGKLVYDFKKDGRFDLLVSGNKSNPEYYKQLGLYEAMAHQFEIEGAIDENGNIWKREKGKITAFPKAYTNKQSESMKSLADDIYGYYSHEKKSLIQSTVLGSMWMQFRTFWSGKKNLYLGPGGVSLQGHFEQVKDGDKPMYYQIDGEDNVRRDLPLTDQNTGYPAYKWQGDWREGVLCQFNQMAKAMIDTKSISEGFSQMWNNPNEQIRKRFRSNIKQINTDLFMWVLFGCIISGFLKEWLKELTDDNKKQHDIGQGLALSAASIAVYSLRNATFDFNFMDSLGTPLTSWTPFAFEWAGREAKNIMHIATGDEDFWDGCLNVFSSAKQVKPFFDSIKPDVFRNDREK